MGQHAEETVVRPSVGHEAEQLQRRGVAPVHVLGDTTATDRSAPERRPLGQRIEGPGAAQFRALGGETVILGDAEQLPDVPG